MWDARDTKEYWEERTRPYLGTQAELASVTATGLPSSFARYTDWLERRTLRGAMNYLRDDAPLLEVGCGYGRWFELWGRKARPFVGMDFTLSLISRARARHPEALWVVADARHLPFRAGAFEGICSVKVLQFLPRGERGQALREFLRVLSSSGTGILLEKIRDQDGSPPGEWTRWLTASGGKLVTWTGSEYAPLDRAFEALRNVFHRRAGKGKANLPAASTPGSPGLVRRRWARLYGAYLAVRRVVIGISRVLEPLIDKILPPHWAAHGLFVFRKT